MKASYIVKGNVEEKTHEFIYVNDVLDYDDKFKCVVVDSLNPDYTLILNSIDFIITKSGSKLAHLAIVSREYNKPIILCEELSSIKINKIGKLSIKKRGLQFEIEIK